MDPRLILTPDGTRLQFSGGQPLMDNGLENLVLISLFSAPGWCGNQFLKSPIGSEFEEECSKPVTRSSINRITDAAQRALDIPALGDVTVTVTNPTGNRIAVSIVCRGATVILTKDGGNWYYQANDPAYLKVVN